MAENGIQNLYNLNNVGYDLSISGKHIVVRIQDPVEETPILIDIIRPRISEGFKPSDIYNNEVPISVSRR